MMLAIGVALKPQVVIADEPTSNLDVTLQAEILYRLREMRQESGSAILLITHDLGVIAQMANEVAVMYGGYVVEYAETAPLFARPLHPYTWGLFSGGTSSGCAGAVPETHAGHAPDNDRSARSVPVLAPVFKGNEPVSHGPKT